MIASGVSGDNARKVAVTGLEREFFRIQMGRLVKKISLVHEKKKKNARKRVLVKNCRVDNSLYLFKLTSETILESAFFNSMAKLFNNTTQNKQPGSRFGVRWIGV